MDRQRACLEATLEAYCEPPMRRMESQLKVELRTENRDRGLTVLLWMKDVLDNLPAPVRLKIRRVAIVDADAAQRDIMEVRLQNKILYLSCKSSLSYLHYRRCHTLFRKMLVRLRLSHDGTPIDQRDTVRRIQMLRQKLRNTLAVSAASKPAIGRAAITGLPI